MFSTNFYLGSSDQYELYKGVELMCLMNFNEAIIMLKLFSDQVNKTIII